MKYEFHWQLVVFVLLFSAGPTPLHSAELGAGFRYSAYGPDYDPGPEYWVEVGQKMAVRFPNAVPETIWIVGRLHGEGTLLNFPAQPTSPLIQVSEKDRNERAMHLFDRAGVRVWLQVEPGNAPVEELIHLVLDRYGGHPSVVGVGIDVEWYRSVDQPEGQPVTDAEASAWLAAARSHNPEFRLFLKHWEIGKMPPTVREGLFFIDDSQILPSLNAMVAEFAEWGRAFAPAPVGLQYGYPSDRPWWRHLDDPPGAIGERILAAVPNATGLYWVDFTVLEIFPPRPLIGVKIYDHEGSFEELFTQWQTLGINAAFVSESLAANAEFREFATEGQVAVFVIAPVFFNPEALAQDPDLFAITAEGRQARDDWVEFVCPSRRAFREQRKEEIVDLVRELRPEGISLDFLRHFVFWEMVHPDADADKLPNSCFCPHCLAGFSAAKNVELPTELTDTQSLATWILGHHADLWTEWKVELITALLEDIVGGIRSVDPAIQINIHAVPWRQDDYDQAIRRIAGQDFEALSKSADYLSPMCYSFMLERPYSWVHAVVRDVAADSSAPILPSIQVAAAYREDAEFSVGEFWLAMHAALEPPSRGVIFWSWEALAEDPEKMNVIQEALRARNPHL